MRKSLKESIEKNLIRLLFGVVLLVLGSLAPVADPYGPCTVYAATQPNAGANLVAVAGN
jgi:hypothetical protein